MSSSFSYFFLILHFQGSNGLDPVSVANNSNTNYHDFPMHTLSWSFHMLFYDSTRNFIKNSNMNFLSYGLDLCGYKESVDVFSSGCPVYQA